MKLDCKNGDYGTVYDGEGLPILLPISADTETGEVIYTPPQVRGDGTIVPTVDQDKGEMVRIRAKFKAPLTFIRDNPNASMVLRFNPNDKWAEPIETGERI